MWVKIIKKKQPITSNLFPLRIWPDGIVQLQGETRLCLTDNKNLKGKTKQGINIQMVKGTNSFLRSSGTLTTCRFEMRKERWLHVH